MTLYEIASQYREVLEMDCANDDERSAMISAIDDLSGEFSDKVENIVKFIRNVSAEADAISAEEIRLANKRQSLTRKAENLTAYIEAMMVMSGLREVKAGIFAAKFRQNPPSVTILDESQLDDRFFIIERRISKTAISDAIKAGEQVPGIEIVRNERLEIK